MLAAADAEKLTIPHIVLASNGEDAEIVKQYKAIIDGEGKTGEVRIHLVFDILPRADIHEGGNISYDAPWMDGRQSQAV